MPTEVQKLMCKHVKVLCAVAVQGLIRRGQKKFDPKEDKVVVSAWLNVSKDHVHGANQSRASFWSRIHEPSNLETSFVVCLLYLDK